ncbi:xanthine dehydrogenase accessory protein XdhC [Paracoccus sediminicola]|uniref:xanthine dehydrogenase accessory protein XdhC n=1 Tax=Paracoccus sediminicola TaxID=3017783 RepID=UPI0022EFF9D8|nr:xanthine dehydrogenase accessory protein XdhC [Paracoccus sediminicola]WBU57962.1 xanthine dehydrogenase accessory protein XdhC [Paracoccus sediminicola]
MYALNRLISFLNEAGPVARLRLTRVRGSSPREAGTEMFVSATGLSGTIGGGQLEQRAIDAAREMLAKGDIACHLDLPLGPEIGQCCGGRVEISVQRMRMADKAAAISAARRAHDSLPSVYVLGAGHVGRALADLLQHLPVRTVLADQRQGELALSGAMVEKRLCAIPEFEIQSAPPGSAFVVLTHDHALDFLLTAAALERGDARYVGMIGSATKRAKFRSWCARQCDGLSDAALTCPIGSGGSRDKRPEIIAAMVAAELMTALTPAAQHMQPDRAREIRLATR